MPLAFTRFRLCLPLGLGKLRLGRTEICRVWSFSLPLLPDINELPNCQHTQLITPGRKEPFGIHLPQRGKTLSTSPALQSHTPCQGRGSPSRGMVTVPGNPRMPENSRMPGSSRIMPQFLLLPSLIPNVQR